MGMLFAGQYYDQDDAAEREIRKLANDIYARADWNFFRYDGRPQISMGWHPERGLIERNWDGYNEGMFVYILALGAPVARRAAEQLGTMDRALPELLARRRADAPPGLRAAVRTPVQPHLHRLPRHSRRPDARGRLRLFREQPPRDLCQPRLLHRQSDALERLFEPTSGA